MNGGGRISIPEAAALRGELEAGLLSLPGPVVDLFWIRTLPLKYRSGPRASKAAEQVATELSQ